MSNRIIIAYGVIGAFNIEDMVVKLADKLAEGWQPYESPFVNDSQVIQAIVKYEEEDLQYVSK